MEEKAHGLQPVGVDRPTTHHNLTREPMPANVYECMFLLDPTKVAGNVAEATKQIHSLLERNSCEILASRPWAGEEPRKLTYSIGVHKKGLYYLTYFRSEGKNLKNLEHDCALNEMILRLMVLKIDPKLVDIMLQVGKDEHALALQSVTSEAAEGEGEGMRPPPDDDGRPRRRRFGGRDGD